MSMRLRCLRCAIDLPADERAAFIAPTLLVCGACLQGDHDIEQTVAAVRYDFPWDGLISRFKFRNGTDLAGPLARLLADAAQRQQAAQGMPRPDLLIPAPLTPERLRERGYNQAWELARRVSRQSGIATAPSLLARVLGGPHQADLPRARRLRQVEGAYAPTPAGLLAVRGRRVAVVDDVMTTGATARELARTLRRAGASAVQVWVLARTPDD